MCDSIDMYGFSNWRPSHAAVPYHYFDSVKVRRCTLKPPQPLLKAPDFSSMKQKYDEPLSNFAFKISLRPYVQGTTAVHSFDLSMEVFMVGRRRLTLSHPR